MLAATISALHEEERVLTHGHYRSRRVNVVIRSLPIDLAYIYIYNLLAFDNPSSNPMHILNITNSNG
jgi:hypothetical protein